VVKIGSSLFYPDKKNLDFRLLEQVAGSIHCLIRQDKEVIVVSSGAIALGMSVLGLRARPKELSYLQAIAAVGQNELMNKFSELFHKDTVKCAQVLLTWEDFSERKRYLNAKNALQKILALKCIPVINENDSISTEEIRFGDNDRLSALVAALTSADILIILSDVDGLLDKDRKSVIRVVDEISPRVKGLACPTDRHTCVGGMITKVEAAKIAVDSGIPCVIANGGKKDILLSIAADPLSEGTLFIPKGGFLAAKKRWIAFGSKSTKGNIIVDDGARNALAAKKSLLSVGILGSEGDFRKGDIISITDKEGREFARAKTNISNAELQAIKGRRSEKEVAHRDNIVIL